MNNKKIKILIAALAVLAVAAFAVKYSLQKYPLRKGTLAVKTVLPQDFLSSISAFEPAPAVLDSSKKELADGSTEGVYRFQTKKSLKETRDYFVQYFKTNQWSPTAKPSNFNESSLYTQFPYVDLEFSKDLQTVLISASVNTQTKATVVNVTVLTYKGKN